MTTRTNFEISTKTSAIQAWIVIFAASLYFFFEFFQVNVFNALDPYLLKTFNLQAGGLGNLSAYYFYAVVFCLVPAGLVLDRFSTKWVIIVEMFLCVLAVIVFAMSQSVWQAKIARLLLGVGGCCVLLSCVRLATRWFPEERMALVIGLIVTFAMLGGILSQAPFTYLTDTIGWRAALWVDAVVGFILLGVIAMFVRDFPNGAAHIKSHTASAISLRASLVSVFKNKQNWLCGIYSSLMNLPVFLMSTFGVLYLVQAKGMPRDKASLVTSMIFLGLIVGSPLIGFISDKIQRRKLCMQISAMLALVIVLFIMLIPNIAFVTAAILFLAFGLITSAQVLTYPVIAESNPPSIIASAESVASVLIMSGGFAGALFGGLMGWHWHHVFTLHHVPLYDKVHYAMAMTILPVGFVISIFCSFLIQETFGRSFQKK